MEKENQAREKVKALYNGLTDEMKTLYEKLCSKKKAELKDSLSDAFRDSLREAILGPGYDEKSIKEWLDDIKRVTDKKLENMEVLIKYLAEKHGETMLHCPNCGNIVLDSMEKCPYCKKKWEIIGKIKSGDSFAYIFMISIIFAMFTFFVTMLCEINLESALFDSLIFSMIAFILSFVMFTVLGLETGYVSVSLKKYKQYQEKLQNKREKMEKKLRNLRLRSMS